MDLLMFIFVAVISVISDGLTVHGPPAPLVAPLGSSVVLPCSVDELLSVDDLEVEWKRTDSETLVHLYQDGESRTEAQQQDYQDRANLFTDQIQRGNFSLRLDNLRAADEGQYLCKVYNQQVSGETVIQIKDVERLLVSGSDQSISASVGEDVTLSCSVDSHITPENFEEVSWKKTDKDENIQVLLYQNNETLPDSAHERYRDRVEFFSDETPKGNFSLRLKSVRTEDKGVYMCEVFAGGLSANTTVELEKLGFSVSHIMVLILCISASGSALLLCILIYYRSPNKGIIVKGPSESLFIPLRDSVILPCYVDRQLLKEKLKVQWKRNNSDLVHLFMDDESSAEAQQQDYKDRAHFFTEEIQHGNFSLHLDNLRAEDEGEYTCKVYRQQECVISVSTKLDLKFTEGHLFHPFFPLGSSVVLPFYVDEHLPIEGLKVEWRRKETKTLVHLYQDGESRPESQQQDYQDRANFFTDQIQHGNFSLQLENLRAEDEGIYECTIYSKECSVHSTITTLVLGFTLQRYPLVVPLGCSVILPCYVGPLLQTKGLEVKWEKMRTKTLVHLYQDGESQTEAQQQDYQDRAHFFTDQIQRGNFSLRLDNIRAKDKGVYRCTVKGDQENGFSISTKLSLRPLDTFLRLQMFLVFCPNILMFLAFVLWGVSEGFLNETITCCTLYILRPLMLFWAAPYAKRLPGNIKTWILNYSFDAEYVVFTIVVYSVFFKYDWDKIMNYSDFDRAMITFFFGLMLLLCVVVIIYILDRILGNKRKRIHAIFRVVAVLSYEALPTLQFIFLFYAFGAVRGAFFIAGVLPLLVTLRRHNWDVVCGLRIGCTPLVLRTMWLVFTLVMNAVMVYFYIITLESEHDCVGWVCMIEFLQVLWAVMDFNWSFNYPGFTRNVIVYLLGSVGVILVSAVVLMTELILKLLNGERAVGDLRIIVFPTECFFALPLLILQVFAPWISDIEKCLQHCQGKEESNQNTEKIPLRPVNNKLRKAGMSGVKEDDSVV